MTMTEENAFYKATGREGFTFSPETGREILPSSGLYGVSLRGYGVSIGQLLLEGRGGYSLFMDSWKALRAYTFDQKFDHDAAIGGWWDAEANAYDLEITLLVEGETEARALASKNRQKAIWDFAGERAIYLSETQTYPQSRPDTIAERDIDLPEQEGWGEDLNATNDA